MIKKTYVFEVGRNHEQYFEKAREAASTAGASLSGSSKTGTFNHRGVHGRYRVDHGLVTIDLDKPIGIPWGPMERALTRFFGHNPRSRQPHTPDL